MYANGSHAGNNHSLYRVKWAADRFAIDSSSVYFDFHDCFKYPPRHDTQAIVKFNRGNTSRPRSNDLYAGCTRRFGMQIRHEGQWKRRQVSTKPSTSWQFTRAPDSFTVGYLSSGVRRMLKRIVGLQNDRNLLVYRLSSCSGLLERYLRMFWEIFVKVGLIWNVRVWLTNEH